MLIFFIIKQAPIIIENYKKESLILKPIQAINLRSGNKVNFPTEDKSLLIMWATWCSPCKVEMKRIQNSINDGKISSEKVFAMNLFEDDFTSNNFIRKSKYTFNFLSKNQPLIEQVGARATPTSYLLDGNRIHKASTGISIIGIYQMEKYLFSSRK